MDSKQALEWAASAFAQKEQARYEKYGKYLLGDHNLEYATPKFASAFGKAFEKFAYNRMPLVVDALADRLQIVGFDVKREEVANRAQEIWDNNRMDVQEGVLEREQFSMGDAYLIVEADPDTGAVLMWPQKAKQVRVRYSEERPGEVVAGVKRWRDGDGFGRLTLYFPDRIEKYRSPQASIGQMTVTAYEAWTPYQPQGEEWPIMLPITDTVPVFHFANNAGLDNAGISELHDVIPIQDALNKSLMDLMVAMEFAAFPQRVIVNVDDSQDATKDSIQKFVAGVDRLLTLWGSSDAPVSFGDFAAANISQYTDVVEMFDTMISRISRIPVNYLKGTNDAESGEAKRMNEEPFIAKAEDRQRSNGAIWANGMRYGVRLSGIDVAPGEIAVKWQDAAPRSEEEKFIRARDMQALGFSFAEILRDLGKDPNEIETIQKERREEDDERARRFNTGFSEVPA